MAITTAPSDLTRPFSTAPPDPSRAATVQLAGVGRTFHTARGDRTVLRDLTLHIEPGEIVAIIGPSGCGKSTLLREVCGLDLPSTGTVTIDGQSVHGIDPRCAVAFQEPRLLPWRTLAHNVSLGLPRGTRRDVGRERVAELLDLVGLAELADHRPRQVSGGQAQRAALARALARKPAVLLLDEPFGALDALTRLQMQDLLLEVHAAERTTVLLVTHDVDEALYLADRVVLLGRPAADAAEAPGRARAGATIRDVVTVPGTRPRDRGDAVLAELRVDLLEGLGVSRQSAPRPPHASHDARSHDARSLDAQSLSSSADLLTRSTP